MIVDGKQIASNIYLELGKKVENMDRTPHLMVFTCDPNFETQKYLNLKSKKAQEVGIGVEVVELKKDINTEEFIAKIKERGPRADGIIVQLPVPQHIDKNRVLESIPLSKDVDSLNSATNQFFSPVVGALKEILSEHGVDPKNKHIVVIGDGKLVGNPAVQWFQRVGGVVTQVTKTTSDIRLHTLEADIIVSGAGVPNLIAPDHVKEGVIILDAGTSEDGGELRGDVDSRCAEKSKVFTPVPGGIGPITIAVLLRNVVDAALQN